MDYEPFQSILEPASEVSEKIAHLFWAMTGIFSFVFGLTLLLAFLALIWKPRKGRAPPKLSSPFILGFGVLMPTVILTGFLIYSMVITLHMRTPSHIEPGSIHIQVEGYQWWWKVHYPESDITTANEIYIPVGKPIRLELTSADVVHSFWVPALHGKLDLVPGKKNYLTLKAKHLGTFRGQCAEYCGVQHAKMAFMVVVLSEEDYHQWATDRLKPRPKPTLVAQQLGEKVFFQASCHQCHTIRETPANGKIGPDLTHIGSRLTLGAATLPNNHGNLAGWIANPQAIKPGNLMPPTYLQPEELHALRSYLEALK